MSWQFFIFKLVTCLAYIPQAGTSPNIENYYIGKGTLEFSDDSGATWRFIGNVTTFEFTPTLTKLDHFSSQQGVKTKDRTVNVEKGATERIVAEEWTIENVQLAFLGGVVETDSLGRDVFEIFATNAINGAIRFTGTNEIGPRYEIVLHSLDFVPGAAINPLSEEWGTLELSGDAAVDSNNSWGTVTKLGEEVSSA